MKMTYRQQQLTIADLQERLAYATRETWLAWEEKAKRDLEACTEAREQAEKELAEAAVNQRLVIAKLRG